MACSGVSLSSLAVRGKKKNRTIKTEFEQNIDKVAKGCGYRLSYRNCLSSSIMPVYSSFVYELVLVLACLVITVDHTLDNLQG